MGNGGWNRDKMKWRPPVRSDLRGLELGTRLSKGLEIRRESGERGGRGYTRTRLAECPYTKSFFVIFYILAWSGPLDRVIPYGRISGLGLHSYLQNTRLGDIDKYRWGKLECEESSLEF